MRWCFVVCETFQRSIVFAVSKGDQIMEDERCCGTGTCIINPEGYCWCGQKWDGEKMSFPDPSAPAKADEKASAQADPPAQGKSNGAT
jgi:hypothetical protein